MICPSFCTEALCSYILFLNTLLVSPMQCLWHFLQVIKYMYMILFSSQVICFGKSLVGWDLSVKFHLTVLIILIRGQYVHLPSLVQIIGFGSIFPDFTRG